MALYHLLTPGLFQHANCLPLLQHACETMMTALVIQNRPQSIKLTSRRRTAASSVVTQCGGLSLTSRTCLCGGALDKSPDAVVAWHVQERVDLCLSQLDENLPVDVRLTTRPIRRRAGGRHFNRTRSRGCMRHAHMHTLTERSPGSRTSYQLAFCLLLRSATSIPTASVDFQRAEALPVLLNAPQGIAQCHD